MNCFSNTCLHVFQYYHYLNFCYRFTTAKIYLLPSIEKIVNGNKRQLATFIIYLFVKIMNNCVFYNIICRLVDMYNIRGLITLKVAGPIAIIRYYANGHGPNDVLVLYYSISLPIFFL